MKPVIKTRLGTFQVTRKGTVAISVVKTKHSVRHHGNLYGTGAITHIEHRKPHRYSSSDTGWYTWVATFGLDGKELPFKQASGQTALLKRSLKNLTCQPQTKSTK